jgi:hypothetical protein
MAEDLIGWEKPSKRLLHASSPGDRASINRPGVESPAYPLTPASWRVAACLRRYRAGSCDARLSYDEVSETGSTRDFLIAAAHEAAHRGHHPGPFS